MSPLGLAGRHTPRVFLAGQGGGRTHPGGRRNRRRRRTTREGRPVVPRYQRQGDPASGRHQLRPRSLSVPQACLHPGRQEGARTHPERSPRAGPGEVRHRTHPSRHAGRRRRPRPGRAGRPAGGLRRPARGSADPRGQGGSVTTIGRCGRCPAGKAGLTCHPNLHQPSPGWCSGWRPSCGPGSRRRKTPATGRRPPGLARRPPGTPRPHRQSGSVPRGRWPGCLPLRSRSKPPNSIEAQFTALRYFTLDGTGHADHKEQGSMIRSYIIWRNRHADDRRIRAVVDRANVA